MPSVPSPEDVHSFGTNARRLETVLGALPLGNTTNGARLAKQISKIRKRVGKVRDLDVLTGYVPEVPHDRTETDCSIRLLEYLGGTT
jgi:CHAD domain-containing protein